jgi:hypothetical protein
MMKVDHRGIGGLQRRLGQEEAADVLQHVGGDALGAVTHCGDAQVGAMGDERCQLAVVEIGQARLVAADRPQLAGEAALPIDLLQQLLDADARQAGFERVAELARALGNFQGVRPLELQPAIAH